MFTHHQIWGAIDRLAHENGLSASGLARRAGLDATTFNKSKRQGKDGRDRWPSTESLSKILRVTQTNWDTFSEFLFPNIRLPESELPYPVPSSTVSTFDLQQGASDGFQEDGGILLGDGWEEVSLPLLMAKTDHALRIKIDTMLPIYRSGDIVVISTKQKPRIGDKVVLRTSDSQVMARTLASETDDAMSFLSFNPDHSIREIARDNLDWVYRITWASQ